MTIEEKLPILTVSYSLGVQILLGIYAILVLPFALTGLIYGFPSKGWECGLPMLIGAIAIGVDLLLIKLFTKEERIKSYNNSVNKAESLKKSLTSVQQLFTF